MEEIWKDITGYEGLYQVSNFGRVKSLERKVIQKDGGLFSVRETIRKQFCAMGYLYVDLYKDFKKTKFRIHSLVAMAFLKNENNLIEINHKNGIKTDNQSENLEWCTHSDNLIHAFKTGLFISVKGENKLNSKLTNENISEIKSLYKTGNFSHRSLAKKFNVCSSTIHNILNNIKWKHLQD
jgi:hypothetical protein